MKKLFYSLIVACAAYGLAMACDRCNAHYLDDEGGDTMQTSSSQAGTRSGSRGAAHTHFRAGMQYNP